jgi:ribosomal peptide maturation radical SAM protein 1
MNSIALISTPWPLFNRPSIQLGTLKAYVQREVPQVQVSAHHLYLDVAVALGYDRYQPISESTWLGEPLYAALMYPELSPSIARFWNGRTARHSALRRHSFTDTCRELEAVSDRMVNGRDWSAYGVAGFSVCFGQLASTLYFAHRLKTLAPSLKIVLGGSACAADMGKSLLRAFPHIDFVISGEGELPLVHLVRNLGPDTGDRPIEPIPGLISRQGEAGGTSQVRNLDHLPMPDYGDYFNQVQAIHPGQRFLPRIPMEISRGCWWRRPMTSKRVSGCAFCNLNLQWNGYRAKSAQRVGAELNTLTRQHQVLSVSFMDNLLPPKGLKAYFRKIQELGKQLRLFSEIRATTPPTVLASMARAGMKQVQVGIEALSTSLLGKLNKGTTAMDNLEIMKTCETQGFPDLTGNLILQFPSSDEQDVAETLANLEFAAPFRPLKGIPFWLGYGSPVWQTPETYGIKRVRNHRFYQYLFPPEILRHLRLMIQGYQGEVRRQNRLWQPVRDRIAEWGRTYGRLHESPGSEPILSYQEGGEFLIIRQRRLGGLDMTHRLTGTSRKIYRFCERQQALSGILNQFPDFSEDKIRAFLRMMVDKRLMFHEGDRYLSLAVPSVGQGPQ